MVWHHSLPLMNSFNKTEAAVFSCRLCFLRAFPFISLMHTCKLQKRYVNIDTFFIFGILVFAMIAYLVKYKNASLLYSHCVGLCF